MAVSGLEQRFAPLVLTDTLWNPWGIGVTAPFSHDADEDEHAFAVVGLSTPKQKKDLRRSHSWSGHATYMQSTRRASPLEPTPAEKLAEYVRSIAEFANKFATPAVKEFAKEFAKEYEEYGKARYVSTTSEVSTSDTSSIADTTLSTDTGDNEHWSDESITKCRTSPSQGRVTKPTVVDEDSATTLAIRNLPFSLTREELLNVVDASGFAGMYDFVYLPHKFKEHRNMGFAFMNFTNADVARQFHAKWHKSRPFAVKRNLKPLNVSVAEVQGRAANEFNAQSRKMDRVRNASFRPFLAGSSAQILGDGSIHMDD